MISYPVTDTVISGRVLGESAVCVYNLGHEEYDIRGIYLGKIYSTYEDKLLVEKV